MAIGLLAPSNIFSYEIPFSCTTAAAAAAAAAATILIGGRFPSACNLASSNLSSKSKLNRFRARAIKEKTEEIKLPSSPNSSSAEEITQKYGLEAGLWKIFSSKEEVGKEESKGIKSKGGQAKELLAKYGGAYLATSITLSLISFSLCYALISAGIDVQDLLHRVGISTNETGEKAGTFALAYAVHKAASPIRFPPTVALTPIVASWIGKKVEKEK